MNGKKSVILALVLGLTAGSQAVWACSKDCDHKDEKHADCKGKKCKKCKKGECEHHKKVKEKADAPADQKDPKAE